ncbi:MAG: hypothetical protein GDA47_02135 [Rhodospirillales bacterium]|nr:hypothetical protein [Rhodospirillales bacterium]
MQIEHQGYVIYSGPAADIGDLDIPADATVEYTASEIRATLRAEIARNAGDSLSLLGTARDTALMTMIHLARLATALKAASNLREVNKAAAAFADLTAAYLAKIDAKPPTAALPYAQKGEAAVLTEIETRATAVAAALAAQKK